MLRNKATITLTTTDCIAMPTKVTNNLYINGRLQIPSIGKQPVDCSGDV